MQFVSGQEHNFSTTTHFAQHCPPEKLTLAASNLTSTLLSSQPFLTIFKISTTSLSRRAPKATKGEQNFEPSVLAWWETMASQIVRMDA